MESQENKLFQSVCYAAYDAVNNLKNIDNKDMKIFFDGSLDSAVNLSAWIIAELLIEEIEGLDHNPHEYARFMVGFLEKIYGQIKNDKHWSYYVSKPTEDIAHYITCYHKENVFNLNADNRSESEIFRQSVNNFLRRIKNVSMPSISDNLTIFPYLLRVKMFCLDSKKYIFNKIR